MNALTLIRWCFTAVLDVNREKQQFSLAFSEECQWFYLADKIHLYDLDHLFILSGFELIFK